jgi:hypothetical protein
MRLALLASLLSVHASGAQTRVEAIAETVVRPYGLRDARAPSAPAPALSMERATAATPQFSDYSWLGGAVQMEAPRQNGSGAYTRPRISVGLPSESMKDWMSAAGLPAEQCLLPMVRARARLSADGEASGTFWLYARCSFR